MGLKASKGRRRSKRAKKLEPMREASTMTRLPLLVQFEYHTAAKEAADLAGLHRALNDDPAVPGLRIPTLFLPNDGTDRVPEPRLAVEAERVLVVVLRA